VRDAAATRGARAPGSEEARACEPCSRRYGQASMSECGARRAVEVSAHVIACRSRRHESAPMEGEMPGER